MVLLELFWSFCKIGFTSFGGLSMVPLINHEMLSHGWMTTMELSDILAIAEVTPGPLGLNCATFAGTRVAGLPGAVCANLGVLLPSFLLCGLVAVAYEKFRDSVFMQKIMYGVRPVSLGLIIGVLVALSRTNYLSISGTVSIPAILIGILAMVLLSKYKWKIPTVVFLSAFLGLLFIR